VALDAIISMYIAGNRPVLAGAGYIHHPHGPLFKMPKPKISSSPDATEKQPLAN
jgi:hypothetical protein